MSRMRRNNLDSITASGVFSDGRDEIPSKRGLPMTVIASLRESATSILIAADSGRAELLGHPPQIFASKVDNKLQKHSKAALAWGTAGSASIGVDQFGRWLENFRWPPTSWEDFKDQATHELAELNAKVRQSVLFAGAKPEYFDVASALVVGWLNGKPQVLEISDRGTSYVIDDKFYAIGSGALSARIIDRAFTAAGLDKPPVERLLLNMRLVCEVASYCAEPIHIWRVESAGVTEIM
jgi:hypothetical protein